MSRNETNKAEPAELPDDTEISSLADYELPDPYAPLDADGNLIDLEKSPYRYFAAAADGDKTRPDGVSACKRMGYEVCTVEKITADDCTLMRVPRKPWEARNRARIAAANRATLTKGNAIRGLPEESTWRSADHGRIAKVR